MKKILLTLGSIAAIATPVAAVVACGTEGSTGESGFNEATIRQAEALEGLGSAIRDDASRIFNGTLKLVKTELKTDKARFTISTKANGESSDEPTSSSINKATSNPAFLRYTVNLKEGKVTNLEEGTSINKFVDVTAKNESYIPKYLDTDITNAQISLKIASTNAKEEDFKVGATFDYKAIAALLQKAKIDIPEVQDSGSAQINSELNEALGIFFNGHYKVKAIANGQTTDEQHNGNDWAILLENEDEVMNQISPIGVDSQGSKLIKFDALYDIKWGKMFTKQVKTSSHEEFVLYIQDSETEPGKVDIFGDLVSKTYPASVLIPTKDGTSNDALIPSITAEVNKYWSKPTIVATELKYDGKPGSDGADFDFILSANRLTDTK